MDTEHSRPGSAPDSIAVDLIAVLVAVTEGDPRVLTVEDVNALPSGPLQLGHRSLQAGLRAWVEQQTHHPPGYIEQLYTFADQDRPGHHPGQRVISISYLGLTRERQAAAATHPRWQSWYSMFPWEDRRAGAPVMLDTIAARLSAWADQTSGMAHDERCQRAAITFGLGQYPWNEELILQRYELLHEAGLVPEAPHHVEPIAGQAMLSDHRRILATGIARLRAKIKYRPVVFELMPDSFTLLQLQRCVEAIAGRLLHKQNFRRLIEQQELVEETGAIAITGGRPAKLFRFRREVLAERAVVGTKLPLSRG